MKLCHNLSAGKLTLGDVVALEPYSMHLEGTVRTFDPDMRNQALASLNRVAEYVAAANGSTIDAQIPTAGSNPSTTTIPR